MTLSAFCLLSPVLQLEWVLEHGVFLAQRRAAEKESVNLYHCPNKGRGFFVEVSLDYARQPPLVLRSVGHSVPLAEYYHYVRLPEF